MLFSEPKIPQLTKRLGLVNRTGVSVLFSEPKIPQSSPVPCRVQGCETFQCSSASRKFLNTTTLMIIPPSSVVSVLFSEPKIPQCCLLSGIECSAEGFQCSSASRKFLNRPSCRWLSGRSRGFSALQRAENSSIESSSVAGIPVRHVSVLFSEPKIPQYVDEGVR